MRPAVAVAGPRPERQPMSDPFLLAVAVLLNVAGFGWLALAMDTHWKQVRGSSAPAPGARLLLRVAGAIALMLSWALCNLPDHATIASLVWVMALTAGALAVAFTLTWRPVWLHPLSRLAGLAPGARARN